MPTITLSKSAVEKLVGKKLSKEELEDRIPMIGTALEEIDGDSIVVEIFPNRPDMLSEPGFARALSSFIGVKTGLREYSTKKGGPDYKIIVDDSVKEVRPHTACAIVKNLDFDDEKIKEIMQLQEKLHVTFGRNRKKLAIGIYPLEKIKLPITYCAKKPKDIIFRPLESEREMTGAEIISDHPTGKEFAHLLEGEKLYPLFIDDNKEVLSMPPIINSHMTGRITERTKEVFIECSGHDFRVLKQCLNIIATSLADIGGEIYEMIIDDKKHKVVSPDLKPGEMKVSLEYVNRIIGVDFKETEIKKLLEKMGFGYWEGKALVPCYRVDILHEMDLAEDIAIAYGYENFEPKIPNVSTIGEEDRFEIFKRKIANILVGLGFLEVISYHLSSKEVDGEKMLVNYDQVMLINSLTSDRTALRSWLLPGLMQILSENTNKEYPQLLFENGKSFRKSEGSETGIEEDNKLGAVLCGTDFVFTGIRQVVDALMTALDLKYEVKQASHPSFIAGRAAKLVVSQKDVGIFGEIKPEVLDNFGLQVPAVGLEMDIDNIFKEHYKRHKMG